MPLPQPPVMLHFSHPTCLRPSPATVTSPLWTTGLASLPAGLASPQRPEIFISHRGEHATPEPSAARHPRSHEADKSTLLDRSSSLSYSCPATQAAFLFLKHFQFFV